MNQPLDLADRLAATAVGAWGQEAAIWLLTQHGHWIPELDRGGYIAKVTSGRNTIIQFNHISTMRTKLIGTNSEWQILRVAADLAGQPVDDWFAKDLTSLDEENRRLVLHAIAWAAGGRTWADFLNLLTDQPTYYLAEYEGAAPALFSTRELAQEYCDDVTRVDAQGRCWDWMPEEHGVQVQCWVDADSDRPTSTTGGQVTALQVDAEAEPADDPYEGVCFAGTGAPAALEA